MGGGGDVTAEENLHGSASYIGPSPTTTHQSGQILLRHKIVLHFFSLSTSGGRNIKSKLTIIGCHLYIYIYIYIWNINYWKSLHL